MAARRLVMVLLVLLVVSTFAATLVPPPRTSDESTTTSTSSTTPDEDAGKLVRATVSADAKRPQEVRIGPRDELELRVTSKRFTEVGIPRLDEVDEVDPFAPAVFDLIPDESDTTYPVRLAGGRVIARIAVSGCCRTSRRSAGTSQSR